MARQRRSWALAGVFAAVLAGCASERAVPRSPFVKDSPDPLGVSTPTEFYSLPNGLAVALNRDMRAPLVAVRVAYRVGWADDPEAYPSLAHLVEHLLFDGSRHVREGQFFELLSQAGAAWMNGLTSEDRTDLFELVPSSELGLALWLESDRMAYGLEAITEEIWQKERRVVEREHAERVLSRPGGLVSGFVAQQVFPEGHRYHPPSVGATRLAEIPLSAARDFFRSHHTPQNAVLVLSGAFDPAWAKRLVAHYFGDIPAREPSARSTVSSCTAHGPRSLRLEARLDRAQVIYSWCTPPIFTSGDAELDVLARDLEIHDLKQALVDSGLALGVGVRQESLRDASVFTIHVEVDAHVTPERVSDAIAETMQRVRARGIDADAIRMSIEAWLGVAYLQHDDILQRSGLIASSVVFAGDPNFLERAIQRYRAVTRGSLMNVVAQYLSVDRQLVTVIAANPAAPVAGRLEVLP